MVTVRGDNAVFSIVYNAEGVCSKYILSRPVVAEVDDNAESCFSYYINRISDLELVIATSYFELTTGNLQVYISWNNDSARREITQRVTTLTG